MISINHSGPVLITGAGSGIGKMVAEFLSRREVVVYASVRKEKDANKLNELPNVHSFRLDVTSSRDVSDAVKRVEEEDKGLYALINNAAVADFWPIIATDEKMLHRVFDVNVYGPLRVTNALIPYLAESKGRIVNVSSISGLFTPMFMSVYSMSKFAIESWSNGLHQELKDLGVKVCVIEPGTFNTKIIPSTSNMVKERLELPTNNIAKKHISWIMNNIDTEVAKRHNSPTPEIVADAIMHALFAKSPRRRYLVMPKKTGYERMLFTMILRVAEFFYDNEYNLTKKNLFQMLENAVEEVTNKNRNPQPA
jgi:NAD(P)-dependent dehydrogenase (short-subunit alcohol dehydrogenase family)